MTCKSEQKQRHGWRAWVAPVVVSTAVCVVLLSANALSTVLAIGVALVVIIGGLALLRLL